MGGLGHYLEQEGLATTQISLVREHTVKIRPPRALWVSFELGRPLGEPDDAAFQRRVLEAALGLLEAPSGPVLADYPEDAPSAADTEGWACPVHFPQPPPEGGEIGTLRAALEQEVLELRPWYDLAVENRGRSTVGPSGIAIDALPGFLTAFLAEAAPENPRADLPLAETLRLACDDLKAYYLEAAAAQPGQASANQLIRWFWLETTAGKLFSMLQVLCSDSEDEDMKDLGRFALVPPF